MKTLIVQIKCELGQAYEVAAYIIDNVIPCHIYSISGPYDLMAIINLEEDEDPGLFVNKHLHKVPGIRDTSTMTAFNAFTPG
ncbi:MULTISPECIES: Lrp/AsnC ligand binding domain-containing protein [Acidocella]|uniref:Lrp/AsnC ligand binding domain-containing protein n=1 Tax=Acidocella TaxID=50709 RepID=UPI00028EC107|nr:MULTISPECIES: Lrp/AsnC ligand binding domain-containing protein [Acidocella]EKN00627.1 AsnC family transcriptional regulator [Acidocella sp. MX-AZ02]WBO60147.1 Lrp/AsnC ligand binding domain-containing protein [Acidocella sp. MX-AZ03]